MKPGNFATYQFDASYFEFLWYERFVTSGVLVQVFLDHVILISVTQATLFSPQLF